MAISGIYSKRGRNNRVRGLALQREIVNIFAAHGIKAWNRDRGGCQHEGGDIEVPGFGFVGAKRKSKIASYLLPEKHEIAVVVRADRDTPRIVIPLDVFAHLLGEAFDTIKE